MKIPYEKTQIRIRMARGYLRLTIRTKYGQRTALTLENVKPNDLNLIFWGDDRVREIQDSLGLSAHERTLVAEGDTLGKYAPRDLIDSLIIESRDKRIERKKSIDRTEKILQEIHKLFLRERRQLKSTNSRTNSGIIPFMDGSTLLWLTVILAAKKDFLKGHDDPQRIDKWDLLTSYDLLDELGNIKRGNEDAWSYITARDFLFEDSYYIDLGNPDDKSTKSINCEDLLETLIENCKNRKIDSSLIDPSMKHLRSSLSKKSGDPKLIAIYCK